MPVIDKSILIDTQMEEVLKMAWDPKIWEQWYAGLSGPDKIEGDGDVGTVVDMHYSIVGFRLPIIVKVTELTKSAEKSIWKGTFEGGMTGSQIMTYIKEDKGTKVEAHVEYEIPGKILGKIGNSKIVEKIQENAIEHSLENLKVLVEHS